MNGGDHAQLTQRIEPGKLTQLYVADNGQRRNELLLGADGTTLIMRVTVSSSKLTSPVVFTLTYKKAP